jgi:hypothetical protein
MALRKRRAAMEMSVGTMVTIVLLMVVLVLGIFFIQKIFRSATNAIDLTDQQLTDELNKLFASGEEKKLVIYPQTMSIEIKKGEQGGFGFAIRNRETSDGSFAYTTDLQEVASNCIMTHEEAEDLLILGKTGSNINIRSGSEMDSAKRIMFEVPESSPLCTIDYILDITKDGEAYTQAILTVKIK